MLQGLVKCAACGGTFHVCGVHNRYLNCSEAKRGMCGCHTYLSRERAEEMLLQVVGDRITNDSLWLDAVVAAATQSWNERQRKSPTAVDELERQIADDRRAERRLADAIELGGVEDIEILTERLRQRSISRRKKEHALADLRANDSTPAEPPTRNWIVQEMQRLREVLAASGPEANAVLRELLEDGITVREAMSEGRKQPYLIGTLRLRVRGVLGDSGASGPDSDSEPVDYTKPIEIHFRKRLPWESLVDVVKQRFDAGLECWRIAEELGCPGCWVPKALACWYSERGLPVPDGRSLRSRLVRPSLAERLSEPAKLLWDRGLPMQDIGRELNCNRDTVTAAVQFWFESRGLAVPDGRHRRAELNRHRQGDPRIEAGSATQLISETAPMPPASSQFQTSESKTETAPSPGLE
jgi:hypothetical protein